MSPEKELVLSIYPEAGADFDHHGFVCIFGDYENLRNPLTEWFAFECWAWKAAARLIQNRMLKKFES